MEYAKFIDGEILFKNKSKEKSKNIVIDVHANEKTCSENSLDKDLIRYGFVNLPPILDECGNAMLYFADLKKLVNSFNTIIKKRCKPEPVLDSGSNKITNGLKKCMSIKDNFLLANNKNMNETDAWFKMLCDKVTIDKFKKCSKKVPIFAKKDDVFGILVNYNVPKIEAAWYVKMVAAYNSLLAETKNKKRTGISDKSLDWTVSLMKYLNETLRRIDEHTHDNAILLTKSLDELKNSNNKQKRELAIYLNRWEYLTQFLHHMYTDKLLDRYELLNWLVVFIETYVFAHYSLIHLIFIVSSRYAQEFTLCEWLCRRQTSVCCYLMKRIMEEAKNNLNPSEMEFLRDSENSVASNKKLISKIIEIGLEMRNLISMLTSQIQISILQCPLALIYCNIGGWHEASDLAGSPLDFLVLSPLHLPYSRSYNKHARYYSFFEIKDSLDEIMERSKAVEMAWSSEQYRQSITGLLCSRLLSTIEILDNHHFKSYTNKSSIKKICDLIFDKKCTPENKNHLNAIIIKTLCHWAISTLRYGEHRQYFVAILINQFVSSKAESIEIEKRKFVKIQLRLFFETELHMSGCIYCINHDAPEFNNICNLYSFFYRNDLFNFQEFIQALILRGTPCYRNKNHLPLLNVSSSDCFYCKHENESFFSVARHALYVLNIPVENEKILHERRVLFELICSDNPICFDDYKNTVQKCFMVFKVFINQTFKLNENTVEHLDSYKFLEKLFLFEINVKRGFVNKVKLFSPFDKSRLFDFAMGIILKMFEFNQNQLNQLPFVFTMSFVFEIGIVCHQIFKVLQLCLKVIDAIEKLFEKLKKFQPYILNTLICCTSVLNQHIESFLLFPEKELISFYANYLKICLNMYKDIGFSSKLFTCYKFAIEFRNICNIIEENFDVKSNSTLNSIDTKLSKISTTIIDYDSQNSDNNNNFEKFVSRNADTIEIFKKILFHGNISGLSKKLKNNLYRKLFIFVALKYIMNPKLSFHEIIKASVYCADISVKCPKFALDWLNAFKSIFCLDVKSDFKQSIENIEQGRKITGEIIIVFTGILLGHNIFSMQDLIFHVFLPIVYSKINQADNQPENNVLKCMRLCYHVFTTFLTISDTPIIELSFSIKNTGLISNCLKYYLDEFRLISNGCKKVSACAVLALIKSYKIVSSKSQKTFQVNVNGVHNLFSHFNLLYSNDAQICIYELCHLSLARIYNIHWCVNILLESSEKLLHPDVLLDDALKKPLSLKILGAITTDSFRVDCTNSSLIFKQNNNFNFDSQDSLNLNCYKKIIQNLLENIDVWTIRERILQVELIIKQCDRSILQDVYQEIAACTMNLFKSAKDLQSDENYDDSFNHENVNMSSATTCSESKNMFRGYEYGCWYCASLIYRLPSEVQAVILKISGQVLEADHNVWSTVTKCHARLNFDSVSADNMKPFLSLILTCLHGQDHQREGLLDSLRMQISKLIASIKEKEERGVPDDGRLKLYLQDALHLRLSLVGSMFDTIQRTQSSEWCLLLTQLIYYQIVNPHVNRQLYNTVLDMTMCLINGAIVTSDVSERPDDKRLFLNIVKKIRKEVCDTKERFKELSQLLPIPKHQNVLLISKYVSDNSNIEVLNKLNSDDNLYQPAYCTSAEYVDKVKISEWELIEGFMSAVIQPGWLLYTAVDKKTDMYKLQRCKQKNHMHATEINQLECLKPPIIFTEDQNEVVNVSSTIDTSEVQETQKSVIQEPVTPNVRQETSIQYLLDKNTENDYVDRQDYEKLNSKNWYNRTNNSEVEYQKGYPSSMAKAKPEYELEKITYGSPYQKSEFNQYDQIQFVKNYKNRLAGKPSHFSDHTNRPSHHSNPYHNYKKQAYPNFDKPTEFQKYAYQTKTDTFGDFHREPETLPYTHENSYKPRSFSKQPFNPHDKTHQFMKEYAMPPEHFNEIPNQITHDYPIRQTPSQTEYFERKRIEYENRQPNSRLMGQREFNPSINAMNPHRNQYNYNPASNMYDKNQQITPNEESQFPNQYTYNRDEYKRNFRNKDSKYYHRPKDISKVIYHDDITNSIKKCVAGNDIPNFLFYGSPGTGKTSTILATCRDLFGTSYSDRVLELNASDDRGIKIVREKVKTFAKLQVGNKTEDGKYCPAIKIIILDEADCMTKDAQSSLRRIMEINSKSTRFCLICNYVSRIIDPIVSRCVKCRFDSIPIEYIFKHLSNICTLENVNVNSDIIEAVVKISEGDMRRAISYLQCISSIISKGNMKITVNDVYTIAGKISQDELNTYVAACSELSFNDVLFELQSGLNSSFDLVRTFNGLSAITVIDSSENMTYKSVN
ncbi:Activator 1 subunit 4 [Intoshia linei]|uniref:Activator 1 subunit 4 n=1 Tax=Intoshia linei TaxID=1819745 RepID=A0A177BDM8_9BILA|nr:Activator 1 subunit 4 [Intoshia linei]